VQSFWASGVSLWRNCAVFLFALLFATLAAQAATIHVPADQPTIQLGINAANPGDIVVVSPGIYYENINFFGKAITVTSASGSANTIIDGGAIAPAVIFNSQETRSSVLSNLTIRNGGATPGTVGNGIWGGIFTGNNSNPTILNNLITQNACNGYFGSGGALLQGNTISGTLPPTTAGCSFGDGAGIYLYSVSPTPAQVIGNIIQNNVPLSGVVNNSGGAAVIVNNSVGPIIENNIIRNNAMTGFMVINTNSMDFSQNLVYGNASANQAGGMYALVPYVNLGPPIGIIENNTFAQNTGTTSQVDLEGNLAQFDFVNNIVVGNSPAPAFLCGYPPTDALSLTPLVIDHNDIFNASGPAYGSGCPDQTGTYGNISADPRFTNPATFNFHPGTGSPVIDAGNNSLSSVGYQLGQSLTDLDGNPRLQDATGVGYPIIDMGAYEVQSLNETNPTTLLITPSAYQVPGGTPITLTASLYSPNGAPTGAVSFFEDGNFLGTSVEETLPLPPGQSVGDFTTPPLTPGIHAFVGTYAGQSPATSATSIKIFALVNRYSPTLTLTSAPDPSVFGQTVILTATITSPDGIVLSPITLTDTTNLTLLATLTPNSAGVATFTTSSLAVAHHTIVAYYAGDATHSDAIATVSQQVLTDYPTILVFTSPSNTGIVNLPATFNIAVSSTTGIPTGTVTVIDGASGPTLANLTLDGAGHATFINTFPTIGTHTLYATYIPTGSYAGSSAVLSEFIDAGTTTVLASSPNPANQGQAITFTANVTNTSSIGQAPTGSIAFTYGTGLLSTQPLVATGTLAASASFTTTTISLYTGSHIIAATYIPTGNFAASSVQIVEFINGLSSTSALTANPSTAYLGQPVTLTDIVAAATIPTGTVTFGENVPNTGLGFTDGTATLDATGHAVLTTTTLSVGTHTITASYPGNATDSSSISNSVTVTILPNPADFTLTLASPSLTVQSTHHVTTTATLTAINAFNDTVVLNCPALPANATCDFTPATSILAPGGNAAIMLDIGTGTAGHDAANQTASPFTLALLLTPLGLFALHRPRTPLRLLLLVLALLPLALPLAGCGFVTVPYVPAQATPPGTYIIPITATGVTTGITHTAQLTLVVTP
jgi:hypothetical protein